MTKKTKSRGCILGLAIGDALGYPAEFISSKEELMSVFGECGITSLPDNPIYTDDTQMTLALGNALLDIKDDNVDLFMDALSKRFVEWLETQSVVENRRAPGNTCLAACRSLKAGVHWSTSGVLGSAGCGTAMRSAPIGIVFENIGKIVDYSINSSKITHGHELAMCGSVTTSLLTRFALDGMPMGCWGNELLKVVSINDGYKRLIKLAVQMAADQAPPDFVLSSDCLGEGWTGHEAAASALYCCLMNPQSYKDAVVMGANTVGDSDSIACITGAIMGAKLGEDAIPEEWRQMIENKDMLTDFADKLAEKTFISQPDESGPNSQQILGMAV